MFNGAAPWPGTVGTVMLLEDRSIVLRLLYFRRCLEGGSAG